MRFGWRNYLWGGLLLTLGLFLGGAEGQGCGTTSVFENLADDSTKEAKVEAAKMAIDDGDYAQAITTLETLCGPASAPTCEPDLISLYASAYAGRAGLNVFDLIQGADQSVGAGSGFTLFSKLFPSPTGANVQDMNTARAMLAGITGRTADVGLQLAITATLDFVVSLGRLTDGYNAATGIPNTLPQLPADLAEVQATLPVVQTDLALMSTGLAEAGLSNQNVAEDINQILSRLSSASPTAVVAFLASIQ